MSSDENEPRPDLPVPDEPADLPLLVEPVDEPTPAIMVRQTLDVIPVAFDSLPSVLPAFPEAASESGEIPDRLDVRKKQRPPHPGFWWSILWFLGYFLIAQIFFGIIGAVIGIVIGLLRSPDPMVVIRKFRDPDFQSSPEFTGLFQSIEMCALIVTEIGGIALAWLVIRLIVGRQWPRRLGLRLPSVTHLILAIVGLPAVTITAGAIHEAYTQVLPTIEYQASVEKQIAVWPLWLAILIVGVGPAIGEELWCRGFLGRGLVGRHGPVVGIFLTSIFFGLAHLDPPHILATFVMGCSLHFIYLMSRSLLLPMLLHLLNNSLSVIASRHVDDATPGLATGTSPGLVVSALLLAAAVGWAFYRSRARLVPDASSAGEAWCADHPGVEHPPQKASTAVQRSFPGWIAIGLVAAALTGLGTMMFLDMT